MYTKRKLVEGVGVNDADYQVQISGVVNGKRTKVWTCPYYRRWKSILVRCYSQQNTKRLPTYIGCSVCDEWLTFSNFKKWMETQEWEDCQLDKDLLIEGNKVYSPDTCLFVLPKINTFILDRSRGRGEYMIGVSWQTSNKKFRAACCNPNGKQEYLGLFDNELDAHLAWKKRKHEIACMLAESELVSDSRLAEALKKRYI